MFSLLNTKVKIRIVKLFAENGELQVSDVARTLRISKSRASECLRELAEKGVLESRPLGKSVLYRLASNSLAKSACKAATQEKALLAEIEKSVLLETRKFKPVSVVLFGSSLKGLKAGSDVDILLLHDDRLEKDKIYEIVGRLSGKFGFHISILTMPVKEFRAMARKGEELALNILANGKLLYGRDMERVVWQE